MHNIEILVENSTVNNSAFCEDHIGQRGESSSGRRLHDHFLIVVVRYIENRFSADEIASRGHKFVASALAESAFDTDILVNYRIQEPLLIRLHGYSLHRAYLGTCSASAAQLFILCKFHFPDSPLFLSFPSELFRSLPTLPE